MKPFVIQKIKAITLPLKVQYIGSRAFSDCPDIQQVVIEDDNYGNYKLHR